MTKIYRIYKATNVQTRKAYVGVTGCWPARKYHHKTAAISSSTRNYDSYFYRAIRKYGWEKFRWEILAETPSKDEAINLESKYIAEHKTFGPGGYNMTSGGDGIGGSGMKRTPLSPKRRKEVTEKSSREWVVTEPDGKIHEIKNLKKFCSTNNISYDKLMYAARYGTTTQDGWKCLKQGSLPKVRPPKFHKPRWEVRDPVGTSHLVGNLSEFCQIHGLPHSTMWGNAQGTHGPHKGWTCRHLGSKRPVANKSSKKNVLWELTDPQGNVHRTYGLRKICTTYNLNKSHLVQVSRGNSPSHKGWVCRKLVDPDSLSLAA